MADSANTSPKWTRPSNTIKVKKRRRGSLATETSALSERLNDMNKEGRLSTKRKNPFSFTQRSKKHVNNSQTQIHEEKQITTKNESQNELFRRLNEASTDNVQDLPECRHTQDDTNEKLQETEVTANQVLKEEQGPKSQQTRTAYDNFPIDWSIKTRLRFTSEKPFSWCTSLKSSEEASGLSAFVKCVHSSIPSCLELTQEPASKKSDVPSHLKSMFHQQTMVWIHPSIPWFKAFPRIIPEPKIAKPSFAVSSDAIQKSMFASWCESFRSIFHLFRAKRCPYFYLCAHQFSILFQAAGIGGSKQMQAIITPTTKGFRDALSREGIEYSLPGLQVQDDERPTPTPDSSLNNSLTLSNEPDCFENACVTEEVEDDDITQDDEAASSWIQSIGLDKKEFPSLDPAKVKMQRDKMVKLDHKPQSLVLVEGADTQALFNFLLNSSSTVAVAGAQAGVPPTLLAPVAYEGSTLQKCKVRNTVIKQKTTSGALESINSLEIAGVILPNSVKGLCAVLKCTQNGTYTASFNVHEPTAPFNHVHSSAANQSPEKCHLMQCGLSDHMINELHTGSMLSKGFLREIVCKDGKYSWSL